MIRFIDGFDHYATADALKKWSSYSGNAAGYTIGAYGRFGSNGVRFNDITRLNRSLPAASTLVAGFAYRTTALTGYGFTSFTAGTSQQLSLVINGTGTISLVRGSTVLATSAQNLSTGVFSFIEWKATFSASCAAHSNVVKVAGVTWIDVPAGTNTANAGGTTADGFTIGADNSGVGLTFDYDDLYVLDGTGTVNNDFIGDMRVEALYPTADATHTDFTIGGTAPAATAWQSVNEHAEDGDTTFITSATPGAVSTFTFGTLSSVPTLVAALQVNTVSRKDDAGTRLGAGLVRVGGADYPGASFGVADSYGLAQTLFELNPATGAAWTPTAVNTLEAGVKLVL